MLRLNPFCDVVFLQESVQFRLPKRVVTLSGKPTGEIVARLLPLFASSFDLEEVGNLFPDYEEEEIQKLMKRLIGEGVVGKSFPKNIVRKRKKEKINWKPTSRCQIGVIESGNLSLTLARLLDEQHSVLKINVSFSRLGEFLRSSGVELLIFLPEKLGVEEQRIVEKAATGIPLITGFRKDAVYYVISSEVGDIQSVFLRVFRGFSLPEDLAMGKKIYLENKTAGKVEDYFSQRDAYWMGIDLAGEISSLAAGKKKGLAEQVVIYDLPLAQKRYSTLINSKKELPLKGLKGWFVGEATILSSMEFQSPADSVFQPPFHLYTAQYASSGNLFLSQEEPRVAGGASKDKELARVKTIMEGIERYAAGDYHLDGLRRAKAKELVEDFVNPADLVAYHPKQYTKTFPLRPFNPETEFFWKECYSLSRKKLVYVIADCIFYPFYQESPVYTLANSSGMAAHFDYQTAVREAVLELSERDAFMVVWFNRLSRSLIDTCSLPESMQKRIASIESLGRKVYLIDISLDLFPVVLAVSTSEEKRPTFICGAGSETDPLKATDKALTELEVSTYFSYSGKLPPKEDLNDIRFPSDHAALFYERANLGRTRFLFGSPEKIPLKEVGGYQEDASLAGMHSYLTRRGFEVVVADLTPPEVKRFDPAISVVRVFLPGIVPIYFGTDLIPLGMERLFALPQKLGYSKSKFSYETVDKFPHPFP
ncbi:MAG: YcaO-like family protein [Candidatus Portnoybacteria bacterium]